MSTKVSKLMHDVDSINSNLEEICVNLERITASLARLTELAEDVVTVCTIPARLVNRLTRSV